MKKPTHYVEVRILPLDGSVPSGGDVAFVTTKLMRCVHEHIVDGYAVAVSFPELREEPQGNTPIGTGSRIRIFGDAGALAALLVRQEFAQMVGAAAISVGASPIREVPGECRWEVLQRWREPEKHCDGFALRAARRKFRRDGKAEQTVAPKARKKQPPYFIMDSASTGQRFRIFLKRIPAEAHNVGQVNTYGLGVPVPAW